MINGEDIWHNRIPATDVHIGSTLPQFTGITYQLKLLMIVLFRAYRNNLNRFRVGIEEKKAGKLDDVVLEYQEGGRTVYRLVQVKHKDRRNKPTPGIEISHLFGNVRDNINIAIYFISYQNFTRIVDNNSITDAIIFTNNTFDSNNLRKNRIEMEEILVEDIIFGMERNREGSQRFRFQNVQNLVPMLRKSVTDYCTLKTINFTCKDNDMQDFLSNRLTFAVNQPNAQELELIIKREIADRYGETHSDTMYNKFYVRITQWVEGSRRTQRYNYFSEEEVGELFETIVPQVRFGIKNPTNCYVGNQLRSLHDVLRNQNGKLVCVYNPKPIGKSELVTQYIHSILMNNTSAVWINACNNESLEESFNSLATDKLCDSTRYDSSSQRTTNSVVRDVYKFCAEWKCLFVFDNAENYDSIKHFLPDPAMSNYENLMILITSRNKKWPENRVEYFYINPPSDDEVIHSFLMRLRGI